jgi:hypothetical protein
MTMVATPGVIGILQSTVPASATTFTVDSAYAAYLAALLVGGAWTYTKARVGRSVEVMKVTGISGQLVTATRELDNTTALTLTAGSELEFTMGASAVQDLINAAALAPAIVFTATGALTIDETSANNYTLNVPVTEVTSTDASLVVTSSGTNLFDLSVNASTIGCCAT